VRDLRSDPLSMPDERGTDGDGRAMPFAGFDPPESNFWRLPNNWFDLAAYFSSWAEHKVVEYILRHTWGYHEYDMVKLITMDEFMHGRKRRDGSRLDAGCGMAENSIKKGINDAVAHGFLIVRVDDSDKGRIKKYYAPRMRVPQSDRPQIGDVEGQTLTLRDQAMTLEDQALLPGVPRLTPSAQFLTLSTAMSDPPTEQKPLAKHLKQETNRNNRPGNVVVLPDATSQHRQVDRLQGAQEAPSHRSVHGSVASQQLSRGMSSQGAAVESLPVNDMADRHGNAAPVPVRADLVSRLVAEGIAPARARSLVALAPPGRIERQLGWIDRRSCRDRTGTLVRAIEQDFSEPVQRGGQQSTVNSDQSKYFRGSYALCPGCGSRPCVGNCGDK
jgi:hypothetical protein